MGRWWEIHQSKAKLNVIVCLGLTLSGGFLICSDQMQSLLVSVHSKIMSVNGLCDASRLKFVVWVIALDPEERLKKVTPW